MPGDGGKAGLLSCFSKESCDATQEIQQKLRWHRATVRHLGCLTVRAPGKAK